MTSPSVELVGCPCGCGLQLRREDADKVAAQIKEAVDAGKPEPRHKAAETASAPAGQPGQDAPVATAPVAQTERAKGVTAGPAPDLTPERKPELDPYRVHSPGPTHY